MSKEIELIQSIWVNLDQIELNEGQIEGLPANPRTIMPDEYEKLKKSLTDNPEMLGLRELYIKAYNGHYVVCDGNMRLKALRELEFEQAPCKIIPESWTAEQIMALIIKANLPFGDWDTSMLLEDWDQDQLADWGLDLPDSGEFDLGDLQLEGGSFQKEINDKNMFSMTFTFSEEQRGAVEEMIKSVGKQELTNQIYEMCLESTKVEA